MKIAVFSVFGPKFSFLYKTKNKRARLIPSADKMCRNLLAIEWDQNEDHPPVYDWDATFLYHPKTAQICITAE